MDVCYIIRTIDDRLLANHESRPHGNDPTSSFGSLLCRFRSQAALTQEELAERAELSVRAISDLERGVNTAPRPFTVRRLADALDLKDDDRAEFQRAATASSGTGAADSQPQGRFLGSLPECRLVGREQEMARIATLLDSVVQGAGHVLLPGGEPASGKTRLLQELTLEARSRGFLVLTGSCMPAELHSPYHPILEAFEPTTSSSPVTAESDPERAWSTIGELAAQHANDRQVTAAVSDAIVRASNSAPVALVLDDLQWADRHTLSVFHGLARATRNTRTLLAGAFSDVALAENNSALAAALRSLSRDGLDKLVTVRRLSIEETAAMIAALMDQSDVSEEFAGFVYRRTKGSPRLIEELVRSLGGRLDLEGEIGAGSMGRVFRAYDRATGRTVAAKLVLARAGIDLDALLRFQQEGAILRSLDHPNIVRIYDSFAEEHVGCIVMEFLRGQSLARVLDAGPLDLARARGMSLQIADALSVAHSQSIVHRDIKPDNVMVLENDRVKVTDFGIARILSVDTLMGTVATTGMRVGTPLYMAPVQIEGGKVDARSDVYGFGAMLYHMVTGRPPFDGSDALAIAVQQIKEQPVRPSSVRPGIPDDWDSLILRALNKEPRKRFRSMTHMKEGIEALRTELAVRRSPRALFIRVASLVAIVLLAAMIGSMFAFAALPHPANSATLSSYLSDEASAGKLSGTVLVAKQGRVALNSGYGIANRTLHIPNGRQTEYALADATTTSLLTADMLQETQPFKVAGWFPYPNFQVCPYLRQAIGFCPPSWGRLLPGNDLTKMLHGKTIPHLHSVTLRKLITGTSGVADVNWQKPASNLAKTEAACNAPLTSTKSHRAIRYPSCANLFMGL